MHPDPFSAPETIRSIQETAFIQLIRYLREHSPFYRGRLQNQEISGLDDLHLLPVTTKEDLQQYNEQFLCVPKNQVVEYCTTSGTLGNPVTLALTDHDLERLAYNEFLSFTAAGLTSEDTILLMLSLDRQFMAGIAYYLGARKLGAGIVRGGPGNFALQLETILRTKPTVLVAVPSFIAGFTEFAVHKGINLNETSVRKIICIGENIRHEDFSLNALGERITSRWNVELYSTYASTEQQTAFSECKAGMGGHHHFDLLVFEILDEQNNPVPPGAYGELVITTLGVEGMPLLRYKTGDVCASHSGTCACGRSSDRISPVRGRMKQLIKYKGTTLYPQSLFNILNKISDIQDYVVHLLSGDMETDELKIYIAVQQLTEQVHNRVRQEIQSALRVVPEIIYLPLGEVQKMQVVEGKRKLYKLIDLR